MATDKKLLKAISDSLGELNSSFNGLSDQIIITQSISSQEINEIGLSIKTLTTQLQQSLKDIINPDSFKKVQDAFVGGGSSPRGWLKEGTKKHTALLSDISLNTGNMFRAISDLPRNMADFLGWGSLFNLVVDNPISRLAITMSKNMYGIFKGLGTSIFNKAFGKRDIDDIRNEQNSEHSFWGKTLSPIKKILNSIYEKISPFNPFEGEKKEKGIFGKLFDIMAYPFKKLLGLLTPLFRALAGSRLVGGISSIATGAGNMLLKIFGTVSGFIGGVLSRILPMFKNIFTPFTKIFSKEMLPVLGKSLTKVLGATAGFIIDFISGFIKGGFGAGIREMVFGEKGIIGTIFNVLKYSVAGAVVGGSGGPIGIAIGAIAGAIIGLFTSYIKNVMGDALGGKSVLEVVGFITGYFYEMFSNALSKVWDAIKWIGGALLDSFKWLSSKITDTFDWFIGVLSKAFSWVSDRIINIFSWFADGLVSIFKWLMSPTNWKLIFNKMLEGVKGAADKVWDILKGIADIVIEKMDKFWNYIIDGFMSAFGSLLKAFASGREFYRKYELEKKRREEEEEKKDKEDEKRRKEEAKRLANEELARKKEEAKIAKEQNKIVNKNNKLEDARNKILEKAKDLAGKSANMLNDMVGGVLQWVASGAAGAGSSRRLTEAERKKIADIDERMMAKTSSIIKDSIRKNYFYSKEELPPVINNNNIQNINNHNNINNVMSDESFEFPGGRRFNPTSTMVV